MDQPLAPSSPAPEPPRSPPPSPFDRVRVRTLALMVLGVGVVVQVGGRRLVPRVSEDAWDLISSLAFALGTLALLLAYLRAKHVSVRRLIGRVPRDWRAWALAAIAAPLLVLSIGTAALQFSLLTTLAPKVAAGLHDTSAAPGAPGTGAVLLQALVGVLAAVMEELLFRGVMLARWERRWGGPRAAVASSLAFALLHLDPLGAFAFALAMCCLYLRTRSLLVPILCHAATNAAVALSDLGGTAVSAPSAADLAPDWGAGTLAVAVSLPFVAWFLYRCWPRGGWRLPWYDVPAAGQAGADEAIKS